VRYSESQLKDGFFAFNVNKGNNFKDVIENYSLKYRADFGTFIFRNKQYATLRDFVTDPEHKKILKLPLVKTTPEQLKSKYRSDTDFLLCSYKTNSCCRPIPMAIQTHQERHFYEIKYKDGYNKINQELRNIKAIRKISKREKYISRGLVALLKTNMKPGNQTIATSYFFQQKKYFIRKRALQK